MAASGDKTGKDPRRNKKSPCETKKGGGFEKATQQKSKAGSKRQIASWGSKKEGNAEMGRIKSNPNVVTEKKGTTDQSKSKEGPTSTKGDKRNHTSRLRKASSSTQGKQRGKEQVEKGHAPQGDEKHWKREKSGDAPKRGTVAPPS